MKDSILYIDDQIENLNSFRMALGINFKIYITEYADEALKMIKENDIKVVISDQKMPEISGLDFLKKVHEQFPHVVCILLTAYFDEEIETRAINQTGIYQFMLKPWSIEDMIQTLNSAIDKYNLMIKNNED